MTIDPFNFHPEQEKPEKEKIFLTKENTLDMIYSEIEKIQNAPIPTWGYSLAKVLYILENIAHKIEEDFKNVTSR